MQRREDLACCSERPTSSALRRITTIMTRPSSSSAAAAPRRPKSARSWCYRTVPQCSRWPWPLRAEILDLHLVTMSLGVGPGLCTEQYGN